MVLQTVLRLGVFALIISCFSLPVSAQDEDKEESDILRMAPVLPQTGGLPPMQNAFVTREQTCDKYAKDTMEQYKWLKTMNCGYNENPRTNSSWFTSYNIEYNKCMNIGPKRLGEKEFALSDVSTNIKERQKAIADCKCKPYAYDAVRQNKENLKYSCGYEDDPRWSSDFSYHYDWCAHGGGNIIKTGNWAVFKANRNRELSFCKKPPDPVDLQANYGKVPQPNRKLILTWKDPAQMLPQAAVDFEIELTINGQLVAAGSTQKRNYYVISGDLVPYSTKGFWKVKSINASDVSDWSSASFKIKDKPVTPPASGNLRVFYRETLIGTKGPRVYFSGKLFSSIGGGYGEKKFSKSASAWTQGDLLVANIFVSNLKAGDWEVYVYSGDIKGAHCMATIKPGETAETVCVPN